MKLLPVLMIIILGIGCKQTPKITSNFYTKEDIMLIYRLGYASGYRACYKKIHLDDYGLSWDKSPSYEQQRVIDSAEFAKMFFK